MIDAAYIRGAVRDFDAGRAPKWHDNLVAFIRNDAVPKGLKTKALAGSSLVGIRRIDAEVWLAQQSATMGLSSLETHRKEPHRMASTVELSPRATTAIVSLLSGPKTAKEVAEAIEPGSDSRGAAQTLRRLTVEPAYVVRNEDGTYKLTKSGRARATRVQKSGEPDSGESSTD